MPNSTSDPRIGAGQAERHGAISRALNVPGQRQMVRHRAQVAPAALHRMIGHEPARAEDGKEPLHRAQAELPGIAQVAAVAHAVELSGRPRREIYARALELAGEADAKGEDDQT